MFQSLDLHISNRRILGAVGNFYDKLLPLFSDDMKILVALTFKWIQFSREPVELVGNIFDLFSSKIWGWVY
jgi:hypothetical protein